MGAGRGGREIGLPSTAVAPLSDILMSSQHASTLESLPYVAVSPCFLFHSEFRLLASEGWEDKYELPSSD